MSEGRGRPLALVFPLFVVLATEDLPFKKLDGLGLGLGPSDRKDPFPGRRAGERAPVLCLHVARAEAAREAVGAVLPFLSLILARPVNYSLQLNKVTEVPPLLSVRPRRPNERKRPGLASYALRLAYSRDTTRSHEARGELFEVKAMVTRKGSH